MSNFAPIALFTYARADHTRATVESLLKNKECADSNLYIFSDGSKTEEKRAAVDENRKFIHSITGFKSIYIIEHETNQGLANSLIAGITQVVNQYGRVIVVEDDLQLSPYFLQFMNEALDKYEYEDKVSAISGYCPVTDVELPETYFLRYFHCWGWATWKRGWDLLNTDTKELLRKIRWKTKHFDLDGSRGNYGMLYCQKVGLVDSWYIRLYASFYLAEKLILFPGKSLTRNIGMDGSGTHTQDGNVIEKNLEVVSHSVEIKNIDILESETAYNAFKNFFSKEQSQMGFIKKTMRGFKTFVRKLFLIDCR